MRVADETSYVAKLKSLGFSRLRGTNRTTPVLSEQGERVGNQTEHWSGRVDAQAERFTVTVNRDLLAKRKDTGNGSLEQ